MRLGLQTQRLDHSVPPYFIRANAGVVKVINPQDPNELRALKEALPNSKFIYRQHFGNTILAGQPLDNPAQRAQQAYDIMMPTLELFPYDYVEAYNETGQFGKGHLYNTFTVELAKRFNAAGQRLLAYSFSVGNPVGHASFPYEQDPERWMAELARYWEPYYAGLAEAGRLALHQYKLPLQDDKFTLLRHRLVRQSLPPALQDIETHLTELGCDAEGNPGSSGFLGSSWNWTPEQYAQWIIDTARLIGDEVASIALFIVGSYGWDSFDVLPYPLIADAIARAQEIAPPPPPSDIIDIVDELPRSGQPGMRPVEQIDKIVIHHVGLDYPVTPQQTASYHTRPVEQGGKGWPTIGYHYYMTEDGTVCKTARHDEITYHVGEHNPESLGIILSGRYDSPHSPPKECQLKSLDTLVSSLLSSELGLGRSDIKGHYELRPTACPGSEWFEKWRAGPEDTKVAQLKETLMQIKVIAERGLEI